LANASSSSKGTFDEKTLKRRKNSKSAIARCTSDNFLLYDEGADKWCSSIEMKPRDGPPLPSHN